MNAIVVEDNPGIREIVVDLLQRRGHAVTAFGDAESAWDWLQSVQVDLAVLDWGLPGMDGLELCRRLRVRPNGERAVVVMLTGRAEPDDLDEVVAAGADDYIAKPFKLDDLDVRVAFAERQVPVHAAQADAKARLRASEQLHRELSVAAERQADQLRLLHRVRRTLSTQLELDVVFRTVVEAIADILGYDYTSLYTLDDDGLLHLRHQDGYDDPSKIFYTIEPGQGIAGTVVKTGQPVHLNDARTVPEFLAADDAVVHEICVPLHDDDQVVGILNVESAVERPLTEDDFQLLLGVAELVSASITRGRLYAEVRDKERLLRSVLDSIHEVVFRTDATGRVLFFNRAWESISGYGVEESLGRSTIEFLRPERRSEGAKNFERLAAGELAEVRDDFEIVTASGETRWVEAHAALADEGEPPLDVVGTLIDITERKRMEEALRESQDRYRHLAMHDPLTGLPNRALLMERLDRALAAQDGPEPAPGSPGNVAILLLDLDGFKLVNDTFGHSAGDRLLEQVARRLERCVRPSDTIARLGGDEFAALLVNARSSTLAVEIAERMVRALRPPFPLEEGEVTIAASVGIAGHSGPGGQTADLIRNADTALYAAKADGRGIVSHYEPAMSEKVLARYRQEVELRRAIENDDIALVYQPAFDLRSGEIVGIEALVRWNHPDLGMLPPGEFLGIAESTGLIVPLGQAVLRRACRDARRWRDLAREQMPAVGINLSARQLQSASLSEHLRAALAEYDLPPAALEVEIVENALHLETETLIGVLRGLRAIGVAIAIDDFGTGFASLNSLDDLPVTAVKIDRRFLSGLGKERPSNEILRAIVALAQSLDLTVTAEGIETLQQLAHVRAIGIERGQGFYFTKPLPAEAIDAMLLDHSPLDARLLAVS